MGAEIKAPRLKVLVIAPNWVGDSIFMLPAVAALRRRYKDAELVMLARPGIAALHQASPFFDEIIALKGGSYRERFALHWRLRPLGFGLCVVFPPSFSSALAAFLTGAPKRLGRRGEGRSLFLTGALPRASRQKPVFEEYLELARLAGAEPEAQDRELKLPLRIEGIEEAQELFEKHALQAKDKRIALCPTSAYGPSKMWPAENHAALAALLKARGFTPYLLCAPDEAASLKGLAAQAGLPLLTPGLKGLAAALSLSAVVVANDSGPLHIAAAVGAPVVGIYGPVDPKWSAPLTVKSRVLYSSEPCSPCFAKDCPLKHHHCMTHITPEQALKAVLELLP